MKTKTSIRYFNKTAIRSRWDQEGKKWWYSATDVVAALTESENSRRYWNTFKSRHEEVSSLCGQLKLTASDGKRYLTDVLDDDGIQLLLMSISGKNKLEFSKWIKGLASPLDEESRMRAYELFENGTLDTIEIGTYNGLAQIHSFLFDGLYSFAGKTRSKNISKDGFIFANCLFLEDILHNIELMPENTFEEIVKKYIEMNIAHPFMEGNGRATRIWLDLMMKKNINRVIDWSLIDKKEYLTAMKASPDNHEPICSLLKNALTSDIDNREIFIKGIDYSYYYEEID